MKTRKISFREVFEAGKGKCAYCETGLADDFDRFWLAQRDRLIPGSKGGEYTPENTVLACAVCNHLRGDYMPERELTQSTRGEFIADIRVRVEDRRMQKKNSDFDSWQASREQWNRQETANTATDQAHDEVLLYEGRWLRVKKRGSWEYCERTHGNNGMAVIIIAVTPQDEVLFVEQYRVPLGARTIEMPAGLVGDLSHGDALEDTLESAAQRELAEETGWFPHKVEVLLIGPTSSGMSNERIAFVRATQLEKVGDGGGVAGEDITVHAVPRAEAPAWLTRKGREGYELDLKLWGGLWMIDRNPDGTPVA